MGTETSSSAVSSPRLLLIPTHRSMEISGTIIPEPIQQEKENPSEKGTFVPQKKKKNQNLPAWSRDGFWRLLPQLDALDALPLTQRSLFGDKPVVPKAPRIPWSCDSRDFTAAQPLAGRGKQCPAIKEPLNCSATRGSSAAF